MKVTHVTQNYAPSRGGTQHTIKKVSEYLVKEFKDEVSVFTTNSYFGPNRNEFKKITPGEEYINGVHVKRFNFIRFHKPFIKYYKTFKKKAGVRTKGTFFDGLNAGPVSPSLNASIKNTRADVICASSVHYLFADYPLWKTNNKKPFVLYGAVHIEHDEKIPEQYLERIHHCDYYIANTTFEKEVLIKHNIAEEKIKVIGAATDVFEYSEKLETENELRKKYQIDQNARVFLYLGRQEASKNIECLLKAYKDIKKLDVPAILIIAGAKGAYTAVIEQNAKEDKSLIIFSDITDFQKCELLKLSDVLVLPSSAESFGVVFLEAWSYNKPVIGANIGAIASLIEEEKDGLLFDAGNARDLILKMKTLLLDKELCNAMGKTGYEKVMRHYTWPVIATKFRDTYAMAIESSKKKK